jgi:SAM-dependent methyltransferase
MLREAGKLDEAIQAYRSALKLEPGLADTYNNLGAVLCSQGEVAQGIDAYKKALAIAPEFKEAAYNLGVELANTKFSSADRSLYPCLVGLLETRFTVTPADIAPAVLSLLRHDQVFADCLNQSPREFTLDATLELISSLERLPLLHKIMRATPLADVEIERLLTSIRSALLRHIAALDDTPFLISFQSSLSLHCLANEYVYFETEEDQENLMGLQNRIGATISSGHEPKLTEILCLASYRPLHVLPWAERLPSLDRASELRERALLQPALEKEMARSIPVLKEICDQVSAKVRDQYEANPYPRWVDSALNPRQVSLQDYLRSQNIRFTPPEVTADAPPRILIAGCGTGQHALHVAARYDEARVLAVDLSRTSIAYAQRKAEEAGLSDIRFMQADILDLGQLEESFDVIECIGVLHHMKDPLEGWNVLSELLVPAGLMKIGLYSARARRDVVSAREEIAALGLQGSPADIRSLRSRIMASHQPHHQQLTMSRDFFSMSEARDMLFHAQEHRFTLPQIKEALDDLGLAFCGFSDTALVREFERWVSHSEDVLDLDIWHRFEEDYPDSFRGMYQFWCQRRV